MSCFWASGMEQELDFSSYNKIKRASNEELADLWMRYFDDKENKALRDELNKDYDKYEAEMTKSRTKEFSESDLFNLIDSMYSKRDGE